MSSVSTDLFYVDGASCPPGLYRSYWERLCQKLFIDRQSRPSAYNVFPDIAIWDKGVTFTKKDYLYTFTITTDSERAPRRSDVVVYNNVFYIIGTVVENEGVYTCSDCTSIESSILAVYAELFATNESMISAEAERSQSEALRILNEGSRIENESARAEAERQRASAESARVIAEGNRVLAEGRRDGKISQMEREMSDFLNTLVLISDIDYNELVDEGEVDPSKIYFIYEEE